ncbi:T9SS type A sorting domain-containing protein [Ulvibacter antarcticus]|uniref:Putative secreted protein (Por secretion system target) n=1 Tax=Ulvibacter antarcticus TaxID=442714 RepID=A0A3L9Y772_9FLAO|nr:T9SS type A sorting domain-containing protein [Ulvibacter antarcticus]RMA56244.1 putative secreted protein (Por secretion system target) [Ulvibacter antarcticus]
MAYIILTIFSAMKYSYLIASIFICSIANSQIVDIPDVNFKNALVNESVAGLNGNTSLEDVDTNNDGEIQVSEAIAVTSLQVIGFEIESLEGIQSFVNLTILYCMDNYIATIDLSQNIEIDELWVNNNELTSLDVSNLPLLEWLSCSVNLLTSLDVSQNPELRIFRASFNQLTDLDVSQNLALEHLWCSTNELTTMDISNNILINNLSIGNNQLTSLNIQNTNNHNITRMWAYNNPDLTCILVDDQTFVYPVCDQPGNTGWCKDATASYSDTLAGCNLGFEVNNVSIAVIYPNPAKDILYISSEELLDEINIYSLSGKLLLNLSSEIIDISALAPGIYFAEIVNDDKKTIQKFIKH